MKHRNGPSLPSPAGFSLLEMLLALFVGVSVCSFIVCALQKWGPRARTQETNNLKQIALAAHAYHDTHKRLPFNGVEDVHARSGMVNSGSYAYQLLPYLEQPSLWQGQLDPDDGVAVSLPD